MKYISELDIRINTLDSNKLIIIVDALINFQWKEKNPTINSLSGYGGDHR